MWVSRSQLAICYHKIGMENSVDAKLAVGSKCGSVGLNSIQTVIIRKAIIENVPTTSIQMLTNHYNSYYPPLA